MPIIIKKSRQRNVNKPKGTNKLKYSKYYKYSTPNETDRL